MSTSSISLAVAAASGGQPSPSNVAPAINSLELVQDLAAKGNAAWKAGKYAGASQFYSSVASSRIEGAEDLRAAAIDKLLELERMAWERMKSAEDAGRLGDVMRQLELLKAVIREFPYTEIRARAETRLNALKREPIVASDAALTRGEKLEAAGDLPEAIRIYEGIAQDLRIEYSTIALKAQRHLDRLKADPETAKRLADDGVARANREAPKLLIMANNYKNNGMQAKAAETLRKVIELYPGSPYADDARASLVEIEKVLKERAR